MPTKKPKTKQKQKQKQSQRVIVNIHNKAPARRRGTTRKTSSRGGGGIPYPVYLNSPNDYAPIIHNVLPSTPQTSIPTNTILSTPVVNTAPIPHIPASKLQTNDEVNIPLIKKIPSRSGGISIDELKSVLSSPSKGLKSIGSNISQPTLFNDDDNLSTITQSISGNRGLPFKQRRAQLKGLPDEIIDARNKHYQEEYYKDIGRKQNIKNKKLDLIARQGIAQARALEMRERAEIENEEDVNKFIFR